LLLVEDDEETAAYLKRTLCGSIMDDERDYRGRAEELERQAAEMTNEQAKLVMLEVAYRWRTRAAEIAAKAQSDKPLHAMG
jgi:hypothetical protein